MGGTRRYSGMQTHVKEALSTVLTFVAIVATVHAGIWFELFGIPDVTILNWPFHYFWFVVGALVTLLVFFWVYHWYTGKLEGEKERLRTAHERRVETDAGSESETGTGTPRPGTSGDD
jgi:putative solute:sodium symporter small subunit